MQKIKGIMASLLCFAIVTMLLPMNVMATESSASGTCGENLTWTLDNQGTLTISGTGEMEDYRILHEEYEGRLYFGVHNAPWRDEDVISVIISDGVTSIGEHAFDGHYELTSVAIPPSVTEISAYAFNDCTGLVSISIPEGVINIGICAFAGCENLDRITIPTSLESVGTNAFDDCHKMLDIYYTGTMAQWRTSNLEASIPHFQNTVIHYDGSPGFAQPDQRKPYTAGQFTDVSETSWYAPYVQTAYEHGMMEGVGDALFCPDGEITLAEALTVACRLHSQYYGLDGVVSTGTPWYQPYVEYARQNGIIDGTISTAYTEPITRALFAQIISNALPDDALPVLNELTAEIPDVPTGSPYSDAIGPLMDAGMIYDSDTIPILLMSMNYVAYANSEHASAIYRLYRAGILTGNDSYGTFTPAAPIQRSAVAAIISRVVEPDQRQKFTLALTPSAANPELVPLDKLANLSSLRKKASDEEMMQAYEAARKIVEPLVHLRKEAQICAVTFALRSITDREITYSMTEAHYNDPYGFFVLNTVSCAGCVRATGLCLNMLGIAYEHVNENQYSHQWARIGVDGRYWISDAYGMFCGLEEEPYKHPEGL